MSTHSSRPPTIPQSGGNAKYAVPAVVLILAAGAIFMWRSMTNHEDTAVRPLATASIAQSSEPPPNPKLDDVPPPPPEPEKPEAGSGPKVVYVQGGGCEGKCTGSAPAELGQALQVRAAQARRCYNQALASDSSLKGHVTLSVRVGPGGNICSASVASNDMGVPGVANCAANIFRSAGSLPAPKGGRIDATVPLAFVPQGL